MNSIILSFVLCLASVANSAPGDHWIGTWGASPQPTNNPPVLTNQTLRQIVHLSAGGGTLRLRISNLYGKSPLVIDAASVSVRVAQSVVAENMIQALTVAQASRIVVPMGEEIVTDPVNLKVNSGEDLAVDFYFAKATSLSTFHSVGAQTSYISKAGNFTFHPGMDVGGLTTSWFFITEVDVLADPSQNSVVTFGDSITDGVGSPNDMNQRWPDFLARRLSSSSSAVRGVINEGIGFNRILHQQFDQGQPSVSGLVRFDLDVLHRSGVRSLIILEGINDIGLEPEATGGANIASQLIDAYKVMVGKAHFAGIRVYFGTLLPVSGSGYYSVEHRKARQIVNQWIRSNAGVLFEGHVDFDLALRDPKDNEHLSAQFDCGDHLHPNAAGYEAMAKAVDVDQLLF